MVAGKDGKLSRRWVIGLQILLGSSLVIMGTVVLASWWLTEPLDDRGGSVASADSIGTSSTPVLSPPIWPEGRLEGEPAKRILLDALLVAADRLDKVDSYTATFKKQERIDGVLGESQILEMKVRHHPFALYLKFVTPTQGKEVVYAEGHHENKVIAHSGGISRLLVPRLALPPTHPLALAGSRHAVTEAGLANLTNRLIVYRKMDINDPAAGTVLDRYTDSQGKTWLRSFHTHESDREHRPFARVIVLYDPETFFPMDIQSYDWPTPGQTGDLLLAEHYTYENLHLNACLRQIDFDPANPEYAFHR